MKLDDTTSGSQYYASNTLQNAFKRSGVREKPGDKPVCGETGLPVARTVDIAVQSGLSGNNDIDSHENGSIVNSTGLNQMNCKSGSEDGINTDSSIVPLCLTVMSEGEGTSANFQQSYNKSPSVTSEQTDTSEGALDFSVKDRAVEVEKSKETETSSYSQTIRSVTEDSNNVVAMETEQSHIAALLQRPGLIQRESDRFVFNDRFYVLCGLCPINLADKMTCKGVMYGIGLNN